MVLLNVATLLQGVSGNLDTAVDHIRLTHLQIIVFYHQKSEDLIWVASLTFPVQSFKLLLELVHEAADGGTDGSQVEVSVDADRRPVAGLGRGRQLRQMLRETAERGRAR